MGKSFIERKALTKVMMVVTSCGTPPKGGGGGDLCKDMSAKMAGTEAYVDTVL